MHTKHPDLPLRSGPPTKARDGVFQEFNQISSAPQVFTDAPIVEAIRKSYPELHLTIATSSSCDYLGYAAAGEATAVPIDSEDFTTPNLKWKEFIPPARRLDGDTGGLADYIQFGKFLYTWQGKDYILYIVKGTEQPWPMKNSYLLGQSKEATEACMLATCQYSNDLHQEIWVFDKGFWQKSGELWRSVEHSSWEDVILEESMKKAIMGEINKFFDSREKYQRLKVPWKRGVIYHGPPGRYFDHLLDSSILVRTIRDLLLVYLCPRTCSS